MNENGQLDDDETPFKLITNKCEPANNAQSSWEIDCGTGQKTRECGVDLVQAQAIRNGNPEPLPVIAKCVKVLTKKKTRWQFVCDLNQNGQADENEHDLVTVVNQERFHNVDFNCGTFDNCFACSDEVLQSFINNKETENPGDILFECIKTLWGEGKARYRYACDVNGNGFIDDEDRLKEFIVKQGEDGTCTRSVADFRCEAPVATTTSTTTSTTTTTTTTVFTQTSTDKCYDCFNLGGKDGVPIESLVVNVNPDPYSIVLSCLGTVDGWPEDGVDNQGRFDVLVHCDINQNGIVDEGEETTQVVGKKRNDEYCDKVNPTAWEINCGSSLCRTDSCNPDDLVASGDFFHIWENSTSIGAECLERTGTNSETWRFYCDDNNNGIYDENEKTITESLSKKTCKATSTLSCGKSPTGQCSPFPDFSCTTADVLTEPNVDWKSLNTNLNTNWQNIFVFRDRGYTGNVGAFCNSLDGDTETWTIYCDDNDNGELDIDEKFINTPVKHERTEGKTNSVWTCSFEELIVSTNFYCGDYELTLTDVLTKETDFTDRGLEPKALKQCGFQYMGPKFYGSPKPGQWDADNGTCTYEGMENAYWETRTAGNPIVGSAGFIQQGLGRDYPYRIAYEEGYWDHNNPDKAPELEHFYNKISSALYNRYIPCHREMSKLGGNIIQYNQMFNLSKGERLFGWESENLLRITNEAYLFYMRNFIDGFFYDISPIQAQIFWKQFDLKRMAEIHDHSRNLWDDYTDVTPNFITNSGDVFAITKGKSTTIMAFEGQLGQLNTWLDPEYYKAIPITAGTLWSFSSAKAVETTSTHFAYGNINYQQMAVMNSVTNGNIESLEAKFPGVDYLDHTIEIMKRTRAGIWTISHFQGSQDCITCDEGDGQDLNEGQGWDSETGYKVPDYDALFARDEMQPCPGVIGQWSVWSNCDRSCGAGIKIRTRDCSDERGPGWCQEDERELGLCNTQKCLSTDENTDSYSIWSEWSDCSASCGEGEQVRTRVCQSELPLSCEDHDAESRICSQKACPVIPCSKLKMNTEYFVDCERSTEECEKAPWWFKHREYFRFTGNYFVTGYDSNDKPIFGKKSNDVRMYYNEDSSAWVIKNNETNMIFAVSGHTSPSFIDSSDWNLKLDGEFVNAESVNASFVFECVGEQPEVTSSANINPPSWGEWDDSFSMVQFEGETNTKCGDSCGDTAIKRRYRSCSVEDLCVGKTYEEKRCNKNISPTECSNQHGDCDADGFS